MRKELDSLAHKTNQQIFLQPFPLLQIAKQL